MTYTAASPVLEQGRATAEGIAAWFAAHSPGCPADEIGHAVVANCLAVGLNGDLVAAQIAHETGWWSSAWAARNNPAGLGVTGVAGEGLSFPTVAAGIQAQVAHLLTYCLGAKNPWAKLDPRYLAAADAGYLASVRVLKDLDGRWAVPGVGYGAALAALANELVTFSSTAGGMDVSNPTAADIGYPVTVRRARDIGPARAVSDIAWFIVHDTEGGAWPGDAEYLLAPGGTTASAHAVIGPNGDLWYEVPITATAWTPGNDTVAQRSVNVELSGFAAKGYTDAQYRSLAAFFRWCVGQGMTVPAKYVGRDDVPGICGHADVADPNHPGQWGGAGHHDDPGPLFDWNKLVAYIGATTDTPARRVDPVTGYSLSGGFRSFYESLEASLGADRALLVIGRPLTEELPEDGLTVQYFERAVFEWHPGALPQMFDVLLRRLGAEALAARKGKGQGQ